ncbi:DUF1902 domain-containing protein [Rugamonas sp.]|uniref:DUF1902 domain-containing protein n=1 Tax=Rugamonas sp. TaxID=1926287 RepID=UPI0025F8D853|nr:DUF1902 domain-containing protein [Rugamonas sp.]
MYRIGYPFWRILSRLGLPLKVRVNVLRDDEAGVFVATSDDLPGLVCEASTFPELIREIDGTIDDLLAELIQDGSSRRAVADLNLRNA